LDGLLEKFSAVNDEEKAPTSNIHRHPCHPEQSEGSLEIPEMFRCAQHDILGRGGVVRCFQLLWKLVFGGW
jgi:hypothetical protein